MLTLASSFPADPVIDQLQRVVVGIVVPTLFLCIIVLAGYLLYNYLSGKDQKSPFILVRLLKKRYEMLQEQGNAERISKQTLSQCSTRGEALPCVTNRF